MPALEVSGVSMAFGGAQVLSDVSLSVAAGGVTGLIGPNGAGKTTLFNVVSGLLEPGAGRVMIEGHDVTKAGPGPARRAVAWPAPTNGSSCSRRSRCGTTSRSPARSATHGGGGGGIAVGAETDRIIELVGLGDVAEREVSELPTARARVVEVARAAHDTTHGAPPRRAGLRADRARDGGLRGSCSAASSTSEAWPSAWSSTTSGWSWAPAS